MDAYVRNLLKKKIPAGDCRIEVSQVLLLAALTLLAAGVRVLARSFVADDWTIYWSQWLLELENRGFAALADDFYDYAPPVMYILYLITLLPINAMTAFKGLCCILEFAGAAVIAAIVMNCTRSRCKAFLSYGIFLFLPTVILNASVWSQCDIIYTFLILCSVYFLLKDRTWAGMWFYGAAFAVKLQTLFIFPFLIVLWLRKRVELKHFLTIPAMYLLGIFPAWVAGRPFMELLGIYAFQGGKDRWSLSIKFPNIYQIIGNNYFLDEYVGAGMGLILGILMLVLFYMAYCRVRVTKEFTILLIVFFGLLATYFLPHMHERYLYLTDAFLLIYAMSRPQRFLWLTASAFLSAVGYGEYLTKNPPPVPYGALAFVQLALLIRLGLDVYRYLHDPVNSEEASVSAGTVPVSGKGPDDWLCALLYKKIRIGGFSFDFLEALLAVCITGAGLLIRSGFEDGIPDWPYLLAEWYLAVSSAVLIWRLTQSRMKTMGTYGIVLLLPTLVAEGTILRGDACVGTLLLVCALLLYYENRTWMFTVLSAGLLLYSVRYAGLLLVCIILWQNRRLKFEQLAALLASGAARFIHSYRIWLGAGYSLETFHWPNIYEIIGKEAVKGQLFDPSALTGLFLALGLAVMFVYLFSLGSLSADTKTCVELLLFFGLTAGYFLPYMDQSYGCLPCVAGVLYFMLSPREFLMPMLLQIITFAGYQERLNGESMMPMALFAAIQFLLIVRLGLRLAKEAGVYTYGE